MFVRPYHKSPRFENDNGFLLFHTMKCCLNVNVPLRLRDSTIAKGKFLSNMALSINFFQSCFISRLHAELSHVRKLHDQTTEVIFNAVGFFSFFSAG